MWPCIISCFNVKWTIWAVNIYQHFKCNWTVRPLFIIIIFKHLSNIQHPYFFSFNDVCIWIRLTLRVKGLETIKHLCDKKKLGGYRCSSIRGCLAVSLVSIPWMSVSFIYSSDSQSLSRHCPVKPLRKWKWSLSVMSYSLRPHGL